MAYNAVIKRLTNVRPHPNADRIQLATVAGNQVVVGLENKEGDLGIFFPVDGQLSEKFASVNDLVGVYKDGKKVSGGFFSEKRRVRAQNFRGEKSEGFWMPIDCLSYTGEVPNGEHEGLELDTWRGYELCNKYFTPATIRTQKEKNPRRGETPMFKKHFDTKQLRFYIDSIPLRSWVVVTEKEHGTSGRYGRVLEELPRKWWQKLLRLQPKKEWQYLMGTRNVIVDHTDRPGFYGSDSFRYEAVEPLKGNLHKGEVVYFEIVGYVSGDTPIMPAHKTKELPHITQKYGDEMLYTYGCTPEGEEGPTRRLRVYRIVHTNEDGHAVELPWSAVKARCEQLGVEHVTEVGSFFITDIELARNKINFLCDGPSLSDGSHIREGVCIRLENGLETTILKQKSHTFGVLEGYIKLDDEYVDLEEVS